MVASRLPVPPNQFFLRRSTFIPVASLGRPCAWGAFSGLLALIASTLHAAESVPDDRLISAGNWNVVAVEWDGKHVDQEWLARLQVVYQADGSWAVLMRRIPVAEGRSTHRQDVSPKTFEMETLGSEGIKPSRYTGIYQLDGDTRVLCVVREGEPRPAEFSAPRHSRRMLVTLKRAPDTTEKFDRADKAR
jgi:uncharacterized protein (TIGR03067 family)